MCLHGVSTIVPPPAITLGDILRSYGDDFRLSHNLCTVQEKALRAIANCRTAALGGHCSRCDHCGTEVIQYNSCRNRHCPTCQTVARLRWVEAREAELLPVPYFHLVFTLPHELNALAQGNPRCLYNLLFQSASSTLRTFANDPKYLGAEPSITMVLHTWGQNLNQHIHLHGIVSGGGLSAGGDRWIPSKHNPHAKKLFLFPVKALSKCFRGHYITALRQAFEEGKLQFAGGTLQYATETGFSTLLKQLHVKPWVVYAKRPFAGPQQVIRYLGRYTHRVAISNQRIISMDHDRITFRYKDYTDHDQQKTMALSITEFIRRFLLHILPNGFMRLRHYGILANRCRKTKLARCRELLNQPAPELRAKESALELLMRVAGFDVTLCPICKIGHLQITKSLEPVTGIPPSTGPPRCSR